VAGLAAAQLPAQAMVRESRALTLRDAGRVWGNAAHTASEICLRRGLWLTRLQEVFQLAHEDPGPTPFWVYILLAIPAPTILLLTITDSWGE
jgi:hypothetical protein